MSITNPDANVTRLGSFDQPKAEGPNNKMEVIGGVIRWSAGQSQADALQELANTPAPDQQRVYTGALQYTAGNDQATSTAPIRMTVSGSTGGRGGVLGTALNAMGVGTTRVTDNCTVELEPGNPATRTSARTAVSMGLLAMDAAGNYVETGTPAASAPPPAAPSSNANNPEGVSQRIAAGEPELFDQATESRVAEAIAPVPQTVYEHTAISALTNGLDSVDWGGVGTLSGLSPMEARARGQAVYNAFESQAKQAAQAAGVSVADTPGYFKWAAENHGEEFKAAMRHLVLMRSTAPIKELARQFMRSSWPSMETLRKHGKDAWTDKQGREFVRINGHVMSAAAAARQGLI